MRPFFAKSTVGEPFIELNEVESTNSYAMQQIQAGNASPGTAYFAYSQTAGKGQHGKTWLADPGANITLSVVLDCSSLSITQLFELSLTVSLATHGLFSKYAGDETKIKWPNDIYWRDRKAGGILIENVIRGDKWLLSVVGIGLNINQPSFSELLKNPVSLKQITGKHFDTASLAKELCIELQQQCDAWLEKGTGVLLEQYNRLLFKKGEVMSLRRNNIVFPCRILGVSASGELLVEGGVEDSFKFGEVEWVI